nr:hypothetical protein [Paraburkholderia kirstenboschensis]
MQNVRNYPNAKHQAIKNVQTFLPKGRAVINDNASAKQLNLTGLLNPIIDVWSTIIDTWPGKKSTPQSTLPSGRHCGSGAAGGIRARGHDGSKREAFVVRTEDRLRGPISSWSVMSATNGSIVVV